MTKAALIDDIILRLTKGAPSDDLELEPRQIAHWFDLVAHEVTPKFLENKMKKGESIDEGIIEIQDDIEASVENVTMLDQYTDRVYIEVEKPILGLKNDRGLIRIITEEGQIVNKIPIERLDSVNKMTFAKPNRENLLHTRINDKIYIHGLSPKHVNILTFSVTYIPTINIADLDDSDDITLPEQLIGLISDGVEEKARRQMFGIADLENDAEDDPKVRNN
jgi:hypothetical protein